MKDANMREEGGVQTPVAALFESVGTSLPTKLVKPTKKKTNKKVTDTYKLRQQSYYLDEDIIQAIEMRLFANKMAKKADETDKSALVRAALSKYLKAELQEIKEKQQG